MFEQGVDIKPYNTFGISAKSSYFSTFDSVVNLKKLIKNKPSGRLMVLGGGSNVLFTKDFDGVILKNEVKGKTIVKEDDQTVDLKVGAGENWHSLVRYVIDHDWGGIENLSLIPGNVGASPMQNIGAYGVEIKNVFISLEAYHIETGEVHTFLKKDCQFGYRESVFKKQLKNQYIILTVTYRLTKQHQLNTSYGAIEEELNKMNINTPTIKDISDAVIRIRQSKLPDPQKLGNAGSFFKNPVVKREVYQAIHNKYPDAPHYPIDEEKVKIPAGWLIEKAGWKGKRFNGFGVHDRQALVLVNYENAKGKEIYALSEKIMKDIEEKFHIQLEREVNII